MLFYSVFQINFAVSCSIKRDMWLVLLIWIRNVFTLYTYVHPSTQYSSSNWNTLYQSQSKTVESTSIDWE